MRGGPAAQTIDEYLSALAPDQRGALERLRKTIRAAAPAAVECISYQLPAFRLNGKTLVLFGAAAGHCAFFPGSGSAVAAHAAEFAGYSTSKGTIRFSPDEPLPASLVRKLVKYRIAENAAPRGQANRRQGATRGDESRSARDGKISR